MWSQANNLNLYSFPSSRQILLDKCCFNANNLFHHIQKDATIDLWMLPALPGRSLLPHLLTTGRPASLFLCFLPDSILQHSNSLSSNPFTLQLNLYTVRVYSPAWLIEWVGCDISGGRWDVSWEVGHDPNIHSAINGQGITLGNSIKAQEAAKSSEQTTITLDDRKQTKLKISTRNTTGFQPGG